MARCIVATLVVLAAVGPVRAAVPVAAEGTPVVLGEWHASLQQTREIAQERGIPLVVLWGNSSCGYCNSFDRELVKAVFVTWRTNRKLVMLYAKDTSTPNTQAIKQWVGSGEWPLALVYWKRAGREDTWRFSARSYTAQQYIDKLESYVGSYVTPSQVPATLLADGLNPPGGRACPGESILLDSFTLQTTLGADAVTSVTVDLSAGAGPVLSRVEIIDPVALTSHGEALVPLQGPAAVDLSRPLPVTDQPRSWALRTTPQPHASMPTRPGAVTTLTGTVSAAVGGNPVSGSNAAGALVEVDNDSPAPPQWLPVEPVGPVLDLAWLNPASQDFQGTLVLRGTLGQEDAPEEGATYQPGDTVGDSHVVYWGPLASVADTPPSRQGLAYRLFSRDTCGNYSVPAAWVPGVPVVDGGGSAAPDAGGRWPGDDGGPQSTSGPDPGSPDGGGSPGGGSTTEAGAPPGCSHVTSVPSRGNLVPLGVALGALAWRLRRRVRPHRSPPR
jgi:hypothetical protein